MKNKIIGLVAFATLAAQAAAYTLTPENVRSDLAHRAPRTVVSSLNKSGQYDQILDFISKGKEEWIRLAPDLAKGSDAGSAETLTIALAEALPLSPKVVLSVVKNGSTDSISDRFSIPINVNNVCSAPFIEPGEKKLKAYFKKTIASVSRVTNPEVLEMKTACLKSLEAVKATLK